MSRSGLVRILCALSLLLVAFAHNQLSITDTLSAYADVNVAEYILPDGTLPEICLTGEGDGSHHARVTHCEACRIVASVDLPTPFDVFLINRSMIRSRPVIDRDAKPSLPVLVHGASPRAPPAFSA
jgi:hypothetical protein